MSFTLAEVQALYSPRWEIYAGYGCWVAVKSCGQRCPNPEHGSRHILFRPTLAELADALAVVHANEVPSRGP